MIWRISRILLMCDSFIWLIVAHICMAVQKIALVALRSKVKLILDLSIYLFIVWHTITLSWHHPLMDGARIFIG